MFPNEERYVAEIEKSIYNVILANQSGSEGIRYVTPLLGKKAVAKCDSTCCEGQGSRILGSLPEFIYSIADDGLYINLYERSRIDWQRAGEELSLKMDTAFPKDCEVRITVATSRSMRANIRIRIPGWAAGPMGIYVNGAQITIGMPGTYAALDRTWLHGDVISFSLPTALQFTPYTGVDRIEGRTRYALEYGPLLMAVQNVSDTELKMEDGCTSISELAARLQPIADQPLHFTAPLDYSKWVWIPYFEVAAESFSCVPMIAFGTKFL